MKLRLKIFAYTCVTALFLIGGNSCTPIVLPMGNDGAATLFLPAFYLQLCSETFGSADLKVTVQIEGVVNGSVEMMDDQVFDIDNDDQDGDNLELSINVPIEGTYMVSVTAVVECHECCSANIYCDGPDGNAVFFGQTMTINATVLVDPMVEPVQDGCENCGC